MKKIFATILVLLMTGFASAQSDEQLWAGIQENAQSIRSGYQTSISMMDIARMANDSQAYQLAAYEKQYHEQMWEYLRGFAQNPAQLRNPQVAAQARAQLTEYYYRVHHRDYRPYDQIQGNLQAWIAQRQWETSTPEGQRSYYARQQQNQAAFQAHQNQMNQANANFDNYMNGLQSAQLQREKDHHQYVNTIHDQYEYVNPYDGQGYLYPNTQSQNPVMQNPDGSYSQLIPYQQY